MVFSILSTLFTTFKTVVFFFLLNDYVKRTYPEKYESLLIEIPLKIIYIYSNCQIIYGKLQRKTNEFIENNPQVKKAMNDIYKICGKGLDIDLEIEYIVNGELCEKYKRTQSLPDVIEKNDVLLIFSDLTSGENCVNKKILQSEINFDYKISNIQFILLELKLVFKIADQENDEHTYKVVLKSDTYNYYVVNNVLDQKFFKYYLTTYFPDTVTRETFVNIDIIKVKIIDQDVNIKTFVLTEENSIILKENEYIICE
jgi:hypothetical protein